MIRPYKKFSNIFTPLMQILAKILIEHKKEQ
jgi:hypothetical protein